MATGESDRDASMATGESDFPCGTWISSDGRVRVQLHRDGRFDESRVGSARTHGGTYRVEGERIHFHDPKTGYRATGRLQDGMLYADGVEFRRA